MFNRKFIATVACFLFALAPFSAGQVAGEFEAGAVAPGSAAALKAPEVVLRFASVRPQPGYEEFETVDGDAIFVAPAVYLVGRDIADAEALFSDDSGTVRVRLTDEAWARSPGSVHGRVAVFLDGRLMAVATLIVKSKNGQVMLSDLLPGEAQRVSRILMAGRTGNSGPKVSLIPRRTYIGPGETVEVEVFISGVQRLRAYQLGFEFVGGQSGSLKLEDLLIEDREDFVFEEVPSVSSADAKGGRLVGAMVTDGVPILESGYAGTFVFRATDDARGRFQIRSLSSKDTMLRDANDLPIGFFLSNDIEVRVGLVQDVVQRR